MVTYLSDTEASALLGACDLTRWTAGRDHAMFALAIQTGLRISELAGPTRGDVTLTAGHACAPRAREESSLYALRNSDLTGSPIEQVLAPAPYLSLSDVLYGQPPRAGAKCSRTRPPYNCRVSAADRARRIL